jgi:hypothetical protein
MLLVIINQVKSGTYVPLMTLGSKLASSLESLRNQPRVAGSEHVGALPGKRDTRVMGRYLIKNLEPWSW